MLPAERWVLTETRMGASTNSTKASEGSSAAIIAGIRYHKRVYAGLGLHVSVSMPGWKLLVEPWYKAVVSQKLRSPDAVLLNAERGLGIVIEVKKNWSDGRDKKLLDEYLGIVRSAHDVQTVPLMIFSNCRGFRHEPHVDIMEALAAAEAWKRGGPTPALLKLI